MASETDPHGSPTSPDDGGPTGEPALASPVPPIGPPLERRLHGTTLVFAALRSLRPYAVPLAILLVLGRGSTWASVAVVSVLLALVASVLRYATLTYRLEAAGLVVRQGLLSRSERHVPLERIQDLRLEQGPLQRLVGVGDLHVDTAGGEGPEITLSVVSRAEVDRLRGLLRARVAAGAAAGAEPEVEPVVLRVVSTARLLAGGASSARLTTVAVAVAAVLSFMDDVRGSSVVESFLARARDAHVPPSLSAGEAALAGLALAAVVVLASVVLSSAALAILFHGFTLSARGDELSRSYGLFTRRVVTLPRRRIQVLEVEETWLRRLAGLATLRADTAGSTREGARASGRDVLLPVIGRDEVAGAIPLFFPDLEGRSIEWRPISRLAVRRGNTKAALAIVLAGACAAAAGAGAWALLVLALLPLAHAWNLRAFRLAGHATVDGYFCTRRGVVGRSTHVVPLRNVQAVEVRQGPFDRRLGLATLVVDTAGQAFTGGGPRVPNLPVEDARILAAGLARAAVSLRYRWA